MPLTAERPGVSASMLIELPVNLPIPGVLDVLDGLQAAAAEVAGHYIGATANQQQQPLIVRAPYRDHHAGGGGQLLQQTPRHLGYGDVHMDGIEVTDAVPVQVGPGGDLPVFVAEIGESILGLLGHVGIAFEAHDLIAEQRQ